MAPVRTPPKDVDDQEVAPDFVVVAFGGETVTSWAMAEDEARAYAEAMNRADPAWRATVRKVAP